MLCRRGNATTSGRIPFQEEVNAYLISAGIGWQLVDGKIIRRGDEGFEGAVEAAVVELQMDGRSTAATEIQEARQALSKRPDSDLRGAVFHAMGALGMYRARFGRPIKAHFRGYLETVSAPAAKAPRSGS